MTANYSAKRFPSFPIPLPLLSRLQNLKRSHEGRYSCFQTPFDELKSAFCATIYTSKQRKFVPLFDSGGTFSIYACAKEISPKTPCSVVFRSLTPCNFDQTARLKGENDEGKILLLSSKITQIESNDVII